eukprot:scaffold29371_cov49-Phaeocystis_antarctica.AAC.1
MAFAMVAGLAPRSLVGAHHHASLQRQAPMRRSVCMSKLTDSAELSSYAPATPPQKPARPRAEASSAEASTAEASTPPVTVQNGPVPELELSVGDKTVTAVGLDRRAAAWPSAHLAGPQLARCASSGRAWWLWVACTPEGEARPPGAQPPPRVLELATHFPAVDPSGAAADPGRVALLGGDRRPAAHGDAERHRLHHRLLGLRLHVDERLPTARRRRGEPSRGRVRPHGQIGLQPGTPTVAAWDAYGCSLAWGSVRPHGQSAPVAGPQLASSASSGRACRLWAACTPRGRGQPTGRPATAFHRRRLTAPPSAMQVRLRAQPRLVPRHTDADRLRAAAT